MELAVHPAGLCAHRKHSDCSKQGLLGTPMQTNIIGKEKVLVRVFHLQFKCSFGPHMAMLVRPWAVFLQVGSEKSSWVWDGRCLSLNSDLLPQSKETFAFKSVLGDSLHTKVWELLL